MSPLTANLKHLYQCRVMRAGDLLLIPIIFMLPMSLYTIDQADACPIPIPMLLIFYFSTVVNRISADTFGKPFSFCLPDHEKTVRKMLLVIWGATVVFFSMVVAVGFLFGRSLAPNILFGCFGLLSLSYWTGATSLSSKRYPLFLLIVLTFFISLHDGFIKSMLLGQHSWWVGSVCSVLSILIYVDLARSGPGRRLCNKPLPAFVHSWAERDIDFIPRQGSGSNAPSRIVAILTRFFIGRIESHRASEFMAALWGQLYLVTGALLGRPNPALLFLIFFPLFISIFLGPQLILNVIWSLMAGVVGGAICAVHRVEKTNLLSRKSLLIRSITATLATAVFITGLLALVVLLNNCLARMLPMATFFGKSVHMGPISWIALAFTVPMVPFFGGIITLFKQHLTRMIFLCSSVVAVMIISIFALIAIETSSPGAILAGFAVATAITWGFHLGVLYFDSMKRSLC